MHRLLKLFGIGFSFLLSTSLALADPHPLPGLPPDYGICGAEAPLPDILDPYFKIDELGRGEAYQANLYGKQFLPLGTEVNYYAPYRMNFYGAWKIRPRISGCDRMPPGTLPSFPLRPAYWATDSSLGNPDTVVAVLDSAFASGNPDLDPKMLFSQGYDALDARGLEDLKDDPSLLPSGYTDFVSFYENDNTPGSDRNILPNLLDRFGAYPPAQFVSNKDGGHFGFGTEHGTMIASAIAATVNNQVGGGYYGTAGAAPGVKILPIIAYSQAYAGFTFEDALVTDEAIKLYPDKEHRRRLDNRALDNLIDAINYAINYRTSTGKKVAAINMSFGSYLGDWSTLPIMEDRVYDSDICSNLPNLYNAFKRAKDADIPVIVAAGNGGEPANFQTFVSCPGVIVVASVKNDGNLASNSNYGELITVSANADNAYTAGVFSDPTDPKKYSFKTRAWDAASGGTSLAAAYVSAAVALMKSADPDLSVDNVKVILENSGSLSACTKVISVSGHRYGHDTYYRTYDPTQVGKICGTSIINAEAAVRYALSKSLPPVISSDGPGGSY